MYFIKGQLSGALGGECNEALSGMTVRLYRAVDQKDVFTHVAARAKDTYRVLESDDISDKRDRLLAEADTDDMGRFAVEISSKTEYRGGPVEIDVFTTSMPGQKEAGVDLNPIQISITTIQPRWRQSEQSDRQIASFTHVISARFWCMIRKLLGIWVICGRVVHCETERPIAGVRVVALDVDWTQDDQLGSALTDADGRYRIYYRPSRYKRTPFFGISLEWFGGPDVYFRIERPDGQPVYVENRRRGRDPDRENVGPCFCAETLCLESLPLDPPETSVTEPQFTHVGKYKIPNGGSLEDFTAAGYADDGGGLAFTGTIELIGALPNGGSTAKEYRFLVAELAPTGTGALTPVTGSSLIAPTRIGSLQYWKNVGGASHLVSENYWLANSSADHNVEAATDGWIPVPTENNPGSPGSPGTGRFVRDSGLLVRLKTTGLVNDTRNLVSPGPAYEAGNALAASQKLPVRTFRVLFQTRDAGTGANLRTDELEKIVLCNATFTQLRHPSWAGGEHHLRAVTMLDIAELKGAGNGCRKISNELHALYTAYHPHLDTARIYFEGNLESPIEHVPAVPAGGEVVSSPGGHRFDTSEMGSCAFILWLKVTLRLTNGRNRVPALYDHIAFCVSQ